ncbi:response regulator [Planctomycetota bacterium]
MILLIEDDLVDAMTVKRALDEIGVPEGILHLSNGEEALDYLRSDVNQLPYLILLDLNMPKMNGIDFLRHIKADECLASIPVIVLSTSKDERDIDQSFQSSVAGYMTKPLDFDSFIQKIRTIEDYWHLNRLPGEIQEMKYAGFGTHSSR